MGPFVSVLAAIVVHAAAQSGFGTRVENPAGLLLGLVLPYALARLAQHAQIVGRVRMARHWITLTDASGWISFGIVVLACGWLETVRRWTGAPLDIDAWPDLALALSFVPFVVYQLIAIDASSRAHGGTALTRKHLRSFQTRMFVACAAPITVFIALSTVVGTNEWLRAEVEHIGLFSALFTLVMVGGLAWMLPLLLRWSWNTTPFPAGPVRDLLDDVARRAEFKPRDVRIWNTGDLMANAAIVGFGRRRRTVLLSDHLLSMLNTRELRAVYAHEIGHARRRHVAIFMAWMAAFVFLGDIAVRAVSDEWGFDAGLGLAVLTLVAWYLSFGWLSRRCELDADLFSYETVGDLPALVSALEQVGGHQREKSGWRHFSVVRRVRFLARVATDADFVRRFRKRIGVYAMVGYSLAAVGAMLQLKELVDDLPGDRVIASLARGRYGEASTLLGGVDGEEADELRELTDVALGLEGPSVASVAEALRGALAAHEIDRALLLAQVALLRGMRGARGITDVLDAALEENSEAVDSALDDIDAGWETAVRTALGPGE